ncbi:MAG: DUF4062 domain-containing protein [Bacteroidota bacterium]|jgi:hypothetical protein|nr:DUF4062 domain-containing protein [Bacteroidota bacterium]
MINDKIKIMVSSTVYGSENDLDQIKYILEAFGYEVIMSKEGNIYVPMDDDPENACIKAVENCDLFFGVIFPRYGSGITHKEFLKAVELDKPRWFIAHRYIEYTRKLMEQFMYDKEKNRNGFDIQPTSVLDSVKVVDMYNDVRKKWVQPFFKTSEIQVFVETQFKDINRRKIELETRNNE